MALIQIRGVSDEAHRRLKERASREGKSLSEYLRLEVEHLAELPTIDEILARVEGRDAVPGEPSATSLARERARRGRT
jgi:antitoxin FitA